MTQYIKRKFEFDTAHRVMLHESKCRNLHGHRYVAEITVSAPELDALDRVVDFSVLKRIVGTWIDERWDHGVVLNRKDKDLIGLCERNGWRTYVLDRNPTAEVMAEYLGEKAQILLDDALRDEGYSLTVHKVRLYETPNCSADWFAP